MLLSDYIEFAADRSIMYEEDNPFAKRLFDALASFVDRRSRIEKIDRRSLIKNFNKKCSALLGNRMGKGTNYWNYFSSRFRTNYYVRGRAGVIGVSDSAAAGNESDFDTIYSKMYDHIMNLLQCGTVKRGTEELSTDVGSVDAFVSQTDQNEEMSDADKKNYFDVDRYLTALRRKRQRVVSQEETFDLYDIDLSDEDMAAVNE